MSDAEDVQTDLSLNLKILEKCGTMINDMLSNTDVRTHITLYHALMVYINRGETQLRLGMFGEQFLYAYDIIKAKKEYQCGGTDFNLTILILIHHTECLLCKGEPDEASLMLETYLPQPTS